MISPVLWVQDVDASLAFYVEKLGFENGGTFTGPDGKNVFGSVLWQKQMVMLDATNPMTTEDRDRRGIGVVFHIEMPDVDKFYAEVKAKGVAITEEIKDQFWGDRTFAIKDPDGYYLMFYTTIKKVTTEEMESAMKSQA